MLPLLVRWNFEQMLADGSLNEREQAFFTNKRLTKFWGKVEKYLASLPADNRQNAASWLVGAFLTPLAFGYGDTGTRDRPTRKTRIRDAQHRADPLISRIAQLAGELADSLENLEDITRIRPCEVRLLSLVHQLIHDDAVQNLSGYWSGVRTYEALRILQTKFSEYPETNDLFKDVPGMASQKASWRDWMREAESNLADMLRVLPGDLVLEESDWLNIVNVLIGNVPRHSMQDARRGCNVQLEK